MLIKIALKNETFKIIVSGFFNPFLHCFCLPCSEVTLPPLIYESVCTNSVCVWYFWAPIIILPRHIIRRLLGLINYHLQIPLSWSEMEVLFYDTWGYSQAVWNLYNESKWKSPDIRFHLSRSSEIIKPLGKPGHSWVSGKSAKLVKTLWFQQLFTARFWASLKPEESQSKSLAVTQPELKLGKWMFCAAVVYQITLHTELIV